MRAGGEIRDRTAGLRITSFVSSGEGGFVQSDRRGGGGGAAVGLARYQPGLVSTAHLPPARAPWVLLSCPAVAAVRLFSPPHPSAEHPANPTGVAPPTAAAHATPVGEAAGRVPCQERRKEDTSRHPPLSSGLRVAVAAAPLRGQNPIMRRHEAGKRRERPS